MTPLPHDATSSSTSDAPTDIPAVNAAPHDELVGLLLTCAGVPRWAEDVARGRPFVDAGALLVAARTAASPWTDDEVLEALARHPRLGERPAGDDRESAMSRREQHALEAGPEDDTADLAARLAAGNRRYEERFGHVFLLRAAGRSAQEVVTILERRLTNTPEVELRAAAANLREIAVLRLADLVGAPSHVTTHVLDAARGRPAAGVGVTLEALHDTWHAVAHGVTDADGRVADLGPAVLHPGTYQVRFATGDWFAGQQVEAFYPEVVVVFRVGAPDERGAGHYHVPLLLSPFAYSTYRGS